MSKPTNAADRWHPQLYTIKATVKLAMDVAFKHMETQHKDCPMDEEVTAAWEVLRVAEQKLRQVIDELSEEGGHYKLVEKKPATA